MIGVGPFSIQVVVVAVAVLLAWLAARGVARMLPDTPGKAAGGLLLDAVFWGFLAARVGYVVQWWSEYAAAPLSMIAISDGGFAWWLGIPVALVFVWWRTHRGVTGLRRPAMAGIIAGVAVWVVANSALSLVLRAAPPMPDMQLATLDGRPVSLAAYSGRPVVLNLWASWCPPCRREMPAFEQVQSVFPGVAFVMINQGETALQAQGFLDAEGLQLHDVLLDADSQAMQALQLRGLPTTLFFDAQGRQVGSHMGEITLPALKDKVLRYFSESLGSGAEK